MNEIFEPRDLCDGCGQSRFDIKLNLRSFTIYLCYDCSLRISQELCELYLIGANSSVDGNREEYPK